MKTLALLIILSLPSSQAFTSVPLSSSVSFLINKDFQSREKRIRSIQTEASTALSAVTRTSNLFGQRSNKNERNQKLVGATTTHRGKRRQTLRNTLAGLITLSSMQRPAWAAGSATLNMFANRSLKSYLKPVLTTLAIYLCISSTISTIQSRKRQSLDATSEWGRYASNPAARGRAVMVLCLRILPYWIRQRFASDTTRKADIRTASGAIFASQLLKLGPLYIKLGQIISCRDNLLPQEWMVAMERLQDQVPAKSGEDALQLAYTAMGSRERFDDVFSHFDDVPLAAASLGQVHRATLKGGRYENRPVAVKLQRPLLREIYNQDLALLLKMAKMIDAVGNKVGGVSQSWTSIFEDAKNILYREIDYRDEADNCVRFNRDFGLSSAAAGENQSEDSTGIARSLDGEPLPSAASWLKAPHVYRELSSERALVMEFVPSIKITDTAALAAAGVTAADKEYLADSLARAYLRCFCVNRFFSTDPHPGNLGVEVLAKTATKTTSSDRATAASSFPTNTNVRLVMYDFGQACELQEDQSEGILNVIESIIDMDSNRCVDAFAKMGVLKGDADLGKVRAKVQDNFETGKVVVKRKKMKKAGYQFKDEAGAVNGDTTNMPPSVATNDAKVKDLEVMGFFTLPAEYAFVARALSQMDGVGKTLDPEFDFISSAAPYIVEVKGTGTYIKDEWSKWVQKVEKQVVDWQRPFLK